MVLVYQIANNVGAGVKKAAGNIRARFADTDSKLLEKAKKKDSAAFSELVKRHQNFIFRTALGYLHDRETARDVTQDVFIKAYRGLPYFRDDSQFSSWLYKICKNHCLNILRRNKIESIEPEVEEAYETSDISLKVRMRRLLGRLEPDYREVIMLRYYQQMQYDEIARYLDIPISTVKIRLYRAKKELKKLYGDKS